MIDKIFFGGIKMIIFNKWTRLHYIKDHPSIQIENLSNFDLNKYSLDILYYIAGWIINSLQKFETEKVKYKKKFIDFVDGHSISYKAAKSSNLPISVIHYHQISNLTYISDEFFSFIQFIESCYTKNLTYEIIITYDDSSLILSIHNKLKDDQIVFSEFKKLFQNLPFSDDIIILIFNFLLLCFQRMRR